MKQNKEVVWCEQKVSATKQYVYFTKRDRHRDTERGRERKEEREREKKKKTPLIN